MTAERCHQCWNLAGDTCTCRKAADDFALYEVWDRPLDDAGLTRLMNAVRDGQPYVSSQPDVSKYHTRPAAQKQPAVTDRAIDELDRVLGQYLGADTSPFPRDVLRAALVAATPQRQDTANDTFVCGPRDVRRLADAGVPLRNIVSDPTRLRGRAGVINVLDDSLLSDQMRNELKMRSVTGSSIVKVRLTLDGRFEAVW